MRPRRLSILTMSSFLALSGLAARAAQEPSTTPPLEGRSPHSTSAHNDAHEKGAYLGVSTSSAPALLRHQLQLPEGVGLVVEFVAPKGPAEQAGLQRFDVLHKLDDQILVNQPQLAVLVRLHKPGDKVKLTVFRDGKSQVLTATLGEHELPPLRDLRLGDAEGMGRLVFPNPSGWPDLSFGDGNQPLLGDQSPRHITGEDLSIVWDNGKTTATLSVEKGHRHLMIKDKSGKSLFDGPIDSTEQFDAIPKALRDSLQGMPFLPALKSPATRPAQDHE